MRVLLTVMIIRMIDLHCQEEVEEELPEQEVDLLIVQHQEQVVEELDLLIVQHQGEVVEEDAVAVVEVLVLDQGAVKLWMTCQTQKEESTALRTTFKIAPGPVSVRSCESPLQLFCHYLTDEVWDLLVTETNRYASDNRLTSPSARPWCDVTVAEMKAFIGILIAMGIVCLPRLEMYWSTSHPFISTTGISSVMPLVRFEQIYRFLYLADSNLQVPRDQSGYDRLFKVRKFLDLVVPRFESEYNLHEQVSIDEEMIPFKRRLAFKQYMKDKPTKWGIKVFNAE